jgi:solute carrier family 45 protein 1/2/4
MVHNQGIHNIFIVIPQFIITGIASIIFAIFEPDKSILHSGNVLPSINGTTSSQNATRDLLWRQADPVVAKEGVNSVAVIFR